MPPRTWAWVLLAGSIGAACGQEPETPAGYLIQSEEDFLKLPPNTPAGTQVSVVYLKFGKLFGEQLKLHASQIPDGRLTVRSPALVERLNQVPPSDSDGHKLVPRRSNIQILGAITRKGNEMGLEVSRIHLLETDEQWFTRRMNQLPEDPQRFIALAHEVSARTKLIEDEQERVVLGRLIRGLGERARKLEQSQLEALPAGAEAWIRFGRRYKDMDSLVQVWGKKEVPEALRRQADQALRQLGARMYLGQWYAYEAFKAKLGLTQVQDGGEPRWVHAERAAFLQAIEQEKRKHQGGVPDFGLFEDSVLVQEASRGNVIRGMRKHHVLQVQRGAEPGESWLPVRVDRLRERYDQGTITWEQWVMPDGTRVYFYNTIVISKEG